MTRPPDAGSRWWHEPLVHFLAIGALLFLVFSWWGEGGAGSSRIVVTPGQIDAIAASFTRTWQRPPTEQELKGQLDEYVREEIATREAMALGLDRDDTVIRRRLRQKLEFLAEDTIEATPPTDADLQAWLDSHPEAFRLEPEIAFVQVCLSRDRRGASVEDDARRLREQLSKSGSDVAIESLGDSVMLPHDVPRTTRTDVARQFGEEFAAAILTVQTGQWTGPVRSGYGVHVVFVRAREDGRLPALADVRPMVEREFTADRRRRQLDAMYARFLDRYRVVVERPTDAPRVAEAASATSGGR
jgi:PPIC-type PPIASE domain